MVIMEIPLPEEAGKRCLFATKRSRLLCVKNLTVTNELVSSRFFSARRSSSYINHAGVLVP